MGVLVKAMIMLLQEDGEEKEAEILSRKLMEQHQRKVREGTIDNNFILRKEIADIHMKWKEYKNAKKVYLQLKKDEEHYRLHSLEIDGKLNELEQIMRKEK